VIWELQYQYHMVSCLWCSKTDALAKNGWGNPVPPSCSGEPWKGPKGHHSEGGPSPTSEELRLLHEKSSAEDRGHQLGSWNGI